MRITPKTAALEKVFWREISKNPIILKRLLTADERRDIALRLTTVKMLESGNGSRQISRELNISRQTVSNIKKSLETQEYESYWERSKTERKKKIYSSLPKKPLSKDFLKYLEGKRAVRTKHGKIYLKF